MHYKVSGKTVESERAAKSVLQPNQHVIDWIKSLDESCKVLDYGCGKLRYTIPISKRVKKVVSIDSTEQIKRIQKIGDEESTTLKKYIHDNLSNVKMYDITAKTWRNLRFDAILCSNVLSAIPIKAERLKIIDNAYSVLKRGGEFLLTSQFRDHYFDGFEDNPNAKKYKDGWFVDNETGASFYGIIDRDTLIDYCEDSGFEIVNSYIRGGSAFIVCTK